MGGFIGWSLERQCWKQEKLHMKLKESWYEKLHRWSEALEAYRNKLQQPGVTSGSGVWLDAMLGKMR